MKHTVTSAIPIALFFAASLLSGCGDKDAADETAVTDSTTATEAPTTTASEATTSEYPGTEEGARALLTPFLAPGADYAALTKPLRPTTDDYKAIFVDETFASQAEATYGPAWDA